MSSTPTEAQKNSAREKFDLCRSKDKLGEPKKKTMKDSIAVKHRRIMSTEFHLSSMGNHINNITPETGSNETAKNPLASTLAFESVGKGLKIEHRRVHSNVVDQIASLPLSYSSLVKPKEASELMKKYTTKLLRYKDLTFKRQKKPTDLSSTEAKHTTVQENKYISAATSPPEHKKPPGHRPSGSLAHEQVIIMKKSSSNKAVPIKAAQVASLMAANLNQKSQYTSPFDLLFSYSSLSKHKRVQSGSGETVKSSLKGIKQKDNRGASVENKKPISLSLKAKKLLMAEPKAVPKNGDKIVKSLSKSKVSNILNSVKFESGQALKKRISAAAGLAEDLALTDQIVKKSKKSNPSSLNNDPHVASTAQKANITHNRPRKVHHKKNTSLPITSPTTKLIENLNLPINMNSKRITMTPDESRKNSPRNMSPRAPMPTSRQGSFIIEEDEYEGRADNYFSHMLYSKQREEEPKPKDILLNFCEGSEDTHREDRGEGPRGTLNNTMRSERSKALGMGSPSESSPQSTRKPPTALGVKAFDIEVPASSQVPSRKPSGIPQLVQAPSMIISSVQPKPRVEMMYSQQNSHRGSEKDLTAKVATKTGGLRIEDIIKDRNDVPLVLQKLMLVNKIKEYYASHPVESGARDIATSLDFYQLTKLIGEGSFAKVYHAVSVLTGKEVAIKKFEKTEIKTEMAKQRIFQEAKILNMLDHPNICRLLEVFENKANIFCVMECAKQGDILKLIKDRGPLDEDIARFIIIQVANGLKYCHSKDILHRDIKLDNVLLTEGFIAKICDFGISKVLRKGEIIYEDCGTPAYTAPEVISGVGYSGFQADIWSLGITLFVMVTGKVPFKDKSSSLEPLHELIKKGEYEFPARSKLSTELQDLIRHMLQVDPTKRITIDQLMEHPWFKHPMVEQLMTFIRAEESQSNAEYARRKVHDLGFPEAAIKRTLQHQILNHIHCCHSIYKHS